MNWFQRHLNWTVVLSWLASYPLFIMFIAFGAFVLEPAGIAEDVFLALVYLISFPVLILCVAGWALRRKNRRLWWLLILFVPFGAIVFLCLENRREFIDIKNGFITKIRRRQKMGWLDMLDPNFRLDVNKDAEKVEKLEQLRARYNIPDEVFAMGITGTYWATEQLQRKLFEQGKEMAPRATDKEIFRELIMSRTTYRNPFGLDISEEEIDKVIESINSIDDLVRYIYQKRAKNRLGQTHLELEVRLKRY